MGLLIRTPFSSETAMLNEKLSPSFYHVTYTYFVIRIFPSLSPRISGIFQNLSEKKTTTFPGAQGVAVTAARA